ncbi:MAG TPA: RHS repeat-associated core domain-containing protein, partial [Blastocatellia bacterium]|nr:RHS repeat-associated core domain-containing protein [Blastocatellia bacterium]
PPAFNNSWSLAYSYDGNSNLTQRQEARNNGSSVPIATSYGYDALNRNVWVSYNDGVTPGLERHYDGLTNGKGRLYYDFNYTNNPATGTAGYSRLVIGAYDAIGRVTSQTQGFLANDGVTWKDFASTRSYDLAGHVLTQGYPSTRSVSYSYGASGRLASASGNLGGTSYTYADTISYNAAGQMLRERFGTATNLYHNLHYNNRLQLVDIRLGESSTDEWNWSRGALVSYYGSTAVANWDPFASSTDNNGNVLRQVNYVPLSGGGNVIPQLDDYSYDALNRITSVSESQQNSAGAWTFNVFTQSFGYDRWGNRTVSCSPCQSGVTGDNFTINTANNRITAKNGVGMTYDAAGNQTYDATGNRWYDGEGRMNKATQSGTTSHYVYDADGKRVRRIVGVAETWQVYGIDGELVAEYAANGSASSPQKEYGYRGGEMLIVAQASPLEIRWMVTDHLGSPRMNIRGTGTDGGLPASVTRHDYLPFGEELFAGVGLRSSSHGYEPPTDGVRQKFTGYEHDSETDLDFAEARYCSTKQGRFTTPDPLISSAFQSDPQSWNRYIYVGNRPTITTDPTGLLWYQRTVGGKTEIMWSDHNPGGDWKEIVMQYTVVYVAINGHVIQLAKNNKNYIDLTYEAMKVEHIRRLDMAKEEAERYVNAILFDFISMSVEGGLTLASGGEYVALKTVVKSVVKDFVKQYVADKIEEAIDNGTLTPTPRKPSAEIRREWEEANGLPWPKDPKTGKNQDVAHKNPLNDGGGNGLNNVEPMPHDAHMKNHKENGDFARWARRKIRTKK